MSLLRHAPLLLLLLGCNPAPAGQAADAGLAPPVATPSAAPAVPSAPPQTSAALSAAPATAAEKIAVQHVLIAYKGAKDAPKGVTRSKAEARSRAEQVRDKARGGADFSALVAEYSEDPGSKERRGSLGTITRDKVVKPFADVAFVLPIDAVSEVAETPFGFHVIKRNQ